MMELMVSGPEPTQQWRRELPDGETVRLGRAPRNGWAVPWDLLISREHCEMRLLGEVLHVKKLDTARNPVYFEDADANEFKITAGQGYRIGQTIFQLVAVDFSDGLSGSHIEEHSFGPDQLMLFKFNNPANRLEVLTKLPEKISRAQSDEELGQVAVNILLKAIPYARVAACVHYPPNPEPQDAPLMMRWDSRNEDLGRFAPSRRLITASIHRGEGILHIWQDADESNPAFTVSGNLDWAFCMPLKGSASLGWVLYVTGQFGSPGSTAVGESDLKGDLRFTQLVSDFISSIRQVKSLEKEQAGLAQFFSPAVMEVIRASGSEEILKPRESDITVLFCDVRGFSKKTEAAEGDLLSMLNRIRDVLGVMTSGILKYDGVISDFQGDAALGFWGWPSEPEDGPLAACRAALHIHRQFSEESKKTDSPLFGFQVGIGVAHGPAIAGKIGAAEQIKVGAFGPVVNMGARLESMTKILNAPILVDQQTLEYLKANALPDEMRCRRLGTIQPYGMDKSFEVGELLPSLEVDSRLSNADIVRYEQAVEHFTSGDWQQAQELLNEMPVSDRTKDFLSMHIVMNRYEPPDDWDGVIKMDKK
jgi:adenylate cyclase